MATIQTSSATSLLQPGCKSLGWWARVLEWVATSRAQRMICLVGAIWLLNGFDLTMTLFSHDQGLLVEQNPVANQVLQQGVAAIVLYQVGLVLIGSYPLLRFRRVRIAELGALIVVLVYASVAVRWSTCYELYTVAFSQHTSMVESQPVISLLRG